MGSALQFLSFHTDNKLHQAICAAGRHKRTTAAGRQLHAGYTRLHGWVTHDQSLNKNTLIWSNVFRTPSLLSKALACVFSFQTGVRTFPHVASLSSQYVVACDTSTAGSARDRGRRRGPRSTSPTRRFRRLSGRTPWMYVIFFPKTDKEKWLQIDVLLRLTEPLRDYRAEVSPSPPVHLRLC